MRTHSVFDTDDCHAYLRFRLEKRGMKSRFASAVKCNKAYVTRVLESDSALSLEQGLRANEFFGHTAEESEFFFAQINLARAASRELRDYFKKKLASLREQNNQLSNRIKNTESLPELTEATYYSLWIYAAVDIATSVPALQTEEALSAYFQISLGTVKTILNFLSDNNLVERKDGRWRNTNRSIFLSSESPNIRKHHLNWRLKAMQLIEQPDKKNLHYSSVISISKADFEKLKEHFIESVVGARAIVKASKDEIIAAYNLDCFQI